MKEALEMRYNIVCDNCGMELNIKKIDTNTEVLKDEVVKVQSFCCPKCDNKYVVGVFDKESDRLRDEWKALDKDFNELKLIEAGPIKDERSRVLLKERDRRKRAMVTHNNRLKQRYLKEMRRRGKRS